METSEIISIVFNCILGFAVLCYMVFVFVSKYKNGRLKKEFIKFVKDDEDLRKFFKDSKNEKEFQEALHDCFDDVVVGTLDAKITFKFLAVDVHKKHSKGRDIAWDFFTLITTSVIGNSSQGKMSEAVKSMYNVFQKSKEKLIELDGYSVVADVILKILNLKIRPILTWTRNLDDSCYLADGSINDANVSDNTKKIFWEKMDGLRESLVEDKYLEFIALCSGSMMTVSDISELINYDLELKQTNKEINADKKLRKVLKESAESEETKNA